MIDIFKMPRRTMDATILSQSIASKLKRQNNFKRIMKSYISSAVKNKVLGIKIQVSGRLGGVDMARTEWYRKGRIPLHTIIADVDYSTAECKNSYGMLGVKVWLFKGERRRNERNIYSKQIEKGSLFFSNFDIKKIKNNTKIKIKKIK